jgi:hypothetical protein
LLEAVDLEAISVGGRRTNEGHIHPLATQTLNQVVAEAFLKRQGHRRTRKARMARETSG